MTSEVVVQIKIKENIQMLMSFLVRKIISMPINIAIQKSVDKAVDKINKEQVERMQNECSANYATVIFGFERSIMAGKYIIIMIILFLIIAFFTLLGGMPIVSIFMILSVLFLIWSLQIIKGKSGVAVYSNESIYICKNKNESYVDLKKVTQLKFSNSKGLVFITNDSDADLSFPCCGKGYLEFLDMLETFYPQLVQTLPQKTYAQQKKYVNFNN